MSLLQMELRRLRAVVRGFLQGIKLGRLYLHPR